MTRHDVIHPERRDKRVPLRTGECPEARISAQGIEPGAEVAFRLCLGRTFLRPCWRTSLEESIYQPGHARNQFGERLEENFEKSPLKLSFLPLLSHGRKGDEREDENDDWYARPPSRSHWHTLPGGIRSRPTAGKRSRPLS